MKGQGSTEYLVILAIVLVVALIVIGLLGQYTGSGIETREQQSRTYWKGAYPFSIMNIKINGTVVNMEVLNQADKRYNLTNVSFDGTDINATGSGVIFNTGQTRTLTSVGYTTPCNGLSAGSIYEVETVVFRYNSRTINGSIQQGTVALYGKCA